MKRLWQKKKFLKQKSDAVPQLRYLSTLSCFKNDVPFDDQLDCEAIEEFPEVDEAVSMLSEDAEGKQ